MEGADWVFVSVFLSMCLRVSFCPQIGDHKFSAHRIVLAASIPYFHAMFTNDMMECKQDEIVMQGMDPRYQTRPLGVTGCFQEQRQPCASCRLGGLPQDIVSVSSMFHSHSRYFVNKLAPQLVTETGLK